VKADNSLRCTVHSIFWNVSNDIKALRDLRSGEELKKAMALYPRAQTANVGSSLSIIFFATFCARNFLSYLELGIMLFSCLTALYSSQSDVELHPKSTKLYVNSEPQFLFHAVRYTDSFMSPLGMALMQQHLGVQALELARHVQRVLLDQIALLLAVARERALPSEQLVQLANCLWHHHRGRPVGEFPTPLLLFMSSIPFERSPENHL
jgi:hypothetical protein